MRRAALNGAFCGLAVGLARLVIVPKPGFSAGYYIGVILGWAMLGSLLGLVIAAVKNSTSR